MEPGVVQVNRDFGIKALVIKILFPINAHGINVVFVIGIVHGKRHVRQIRQRARLFAAVNSTAFQVERKTEQAPVGAVEIRLSAHLAKAQMSPTVGQRIAFLRVKLTAVFQILVLHTGRKSPIHAGICKGQAPGNDRALQAEIVILREKEKVFAIPAGTVEPKERTHVAVFSHFASTKGCKMMIEGKAIVFAVLTFQGQLFTARRVVKSQIDIAASPTAHNIADFGQVTVASHRSVVGESVWLNAVGQSNPDKRKRNQSGFQYKLHAGKVVKMWNVRCEMWNELRLIKIACHQVSRGDVQNFRSNCI